MPQPGFLEDDDLDLTDLDPEGEDADDEAVEDPKVLKARLAAEREARLAAEQRAERERERSDEWLRGAHARQPVNSQPHPRIELGPMPDPTDREAYAAWDAKREAIREQRAQQQEEARARAEEERQLEVAQRVALWERFREKYPSMANREALAGAAYRELQSTGKLPKGTEAIVDAVAREMKRLSGAPTGNRTRGTGPAGERSQAPKKPGSQETFPGMAQSIIKRKQELGLL